MPKAEAIAQTPAPPPIAGAAGYPVPRRASLSGLGPDYNSIRAVKISSECRLPRPQSSLRPSSSCELDIRRSYGEQTGRVASL